MERLIAGLINIETEAALLLREAEQKRLALPQSVKQQTNEIIMRTEQETARAIADMRAAAATERDDAIADIMSKHERAQQAMRKMLEENRERWETDIFERILGR